MNTQLDGIRQKTLEDYYPGMYISRQYLPCGHMLIVRATKDGPHEVAQKVMYEELRREAVKHNENCNKPFGLIDAH